MLSTSHPVSSEVADALSAALQYVFVDSARRGSCVSGAHPAPVSSSTWAGSPSPTAIARVELGLGRDREILISAQELSAPSSLEHVLAREIFGALGASLDGHPPSPLDVPRLREVLEQAQRSMRSSPETWTNHTSAGRIWHIGAAHAQAAAEAGVRVYDALHAQAHQADRTRLPPGAAGQSDSRSRASVEASVAALHSCAQLHAAVRLPAAEASSLHALATETAKSLLSNVQLRLDSVVGRVLNCKPAVDAAPTAARLDRNGTGGGRAASGQPAESAGLGAVDRRWRLGTLRAESLSELRFEAELASRALSVSVAAAGAHTVEPPRLRSLLDTAHRALRQSPTAHEYVCAVRSCCEALGLPQPEEWLRAQAGTAGIAALLSHVQKAQQAAARGSAVGPVGGVREELRRAAAVAEAQRERDVAREQARVATEAHGAQAAEIRRLSELIEGYQRRLGERTT